MFFDDGFMKIVKGIHMSKIKRPANEKTPQSHDSPIPPAGAPILPVTPICKKPFKINPIPKFDLSKFNLPEIPEGEWCCPWINDTPIGYEGFLLNADGSKRPTVLVQDDRLPTGWTKHLYQRSSTSGKWDVVLVGPNNKRFRSKNDVKVYLEETHRSYNPDIYDFSIHKRRAKDVGVYVYTDDYVPPVISKPASDFKLDSSLDSSFQDLKQEPFTGFTPNESTSSILSKITQEIKAEGAPHIKTEPFTPTIGSVEEGFTYVGALKVQMVDNLFQCPKEGCNKSFRKENHLQIHVKHYHQELSEQLGACPNMTELAYFRTMGTPMEESSPKNQIPNTQYFEKTYQSEIRTIRKSTSPTRIKGEVKTEDQSTPVASVSDSQPGENLKRKLSTNQASPEVKEKRKPSATDKVLSPDAGPNDGMIADELDLLPVSIIPKKAEIGVAIDSKPVVPKAVIPRFKIGHAAKLKTNKVSKRKGKTFKKFKKLGKAFKRKKYEAVRPVLKHEGVGISEFRPTPASHSFSLVPRRPRPNRLKFLQYSSTDSNSENSNLDQRPGSRYINENGKLIKIVRMRQEEIINCLCTFGEEDGLMIQCELCLCWQHGGCNGIEKESEVPEKYVCYICRNPERARESMKYIHDQEWLYEGKLFHANYHPTSRQAPLRFDILKQSHTLSGNLLELKRSLHSLNVKINIAANKDHPKMYLWSKKWEQSPPRTIESNIDVVTKAERKAKQIPATPPNTPAFDTKHEIAHINPEPNELQKSTEIESAASKDENQTEKTSTANTESTNPSKDESSENSAEKIEKPEIKEAPPTQQPVKLVSSPKKVVKPTPNIPEPEAAIDSVECQHRLLEHIQKEQNAILSRMQTIDAQIIGEFKAFDYSILSRNDGIVIQFKCQGT